MRAARRTCRAGAAKPADIDLADIQGNVLRGYTMPAAAYLFLRIVDVAAASRADGPDAAAGRHRRAVERAARDGDERRVHVLRAAALGLAEVLASFPPAFREGMAARADHLGDRGPCAPANWVDGLGTGDAHVLVSVYAADKEHLQAALAEVIGADGEQAVALVHLQRAEALAGGRDHFGFFDGIAQPAVPAPASSRGPATASPTAPAAGASSRPARSCWATATRTGRCPPRPRAPFDRNGTFVVYRKLAMDVGRVPPLPDRGGRALPRRAAPARRRRSSAAGPTARRSSVSPDRPGRGRLEHQARINDFGYADDPLGLQAARSAPTSAARTRATRPASSTAGCPTATASSAAAARTARRCPPARTRTTAPTAA